MPTANAASLGNFLETPVSKYTGVPSINIPLYEISDGNLNASVALSYHAAGVRPDAHASWVGLGWALQSGGVISRVVRGKMDEIDGDAGGFYDNHVESLGGNDWTSTAKMQERATRNFIDVAPDEFSFNVGGISGTFLMDHEGNWKVRSDQDIKVIFNPADFTLPFIANYPPNPYGRTQYFRVFGKFTLIAGDGTKYIFGGTNNAIDYSLDFFNQNSSDWVATSWYLTQIISADGVHSINFSYERDQFTNVLYSDKFHSYYSVSTSTLEGCTTYLDESKTTFKINGNLLAPVYLKSIETSKELLQFERSTSVELRYDSLAVSAAYSVYNYKPDTSETFIQRLLTIAERQNTSDTTLYKFLPYLRQNGLTSYPSMLNNLQWKKLDHVLIKDKYTNQFVRKFSFNYTNDVKKRLTLLSLKESNPSASTADTIPPYRFYYDETATLPGYISGYVDDWGYYKKNNIPNDFTWERPADPENIIAATLRKIVFPTGGYKLFYFEPNDFSGQLLEYGSDRIEQKIGGGLRIKAIHDYDPVSKSVKSTRYFYVKNFSSPNQLNKISSGFSKFLPKHLYYFQTHTLPTGEVFSAKLKSRGSIIPQNENAEGSPIGYSEVAEVFQDNSFIVSKFTNYDDGHLDEGTINSLYPEKGVTNAYTSLSLERGKLKYEATYNSLGQKLRSTSITYQPLHNERSYVRMSDVQRFQVCYQYEYMRGLGGPYIYEGGTYKFYTYPYVPTSQVDSVFDGNIPMVKVTNMYYDNPLNKLLTRTEQKRTDGKIITNIISYPQDYSSGTGFIDQMLLKNLTSLPIETINYLTEPNSGVVKILSGQLNTYSPTEPFLKDTEYLLETDKPIPLSTFKFSDAANGTLPNMASKTPFDKDARYRGIKNYLYDNLGNLIQANAINGISSSIIWGYNQKIPVAQAINAKSTEIFYDGFEELATGSSTDAKVGLKSLLLNGGSYTLPTLTSLSGSLRYKVTFWYKNSGQSWKYMSTSYSQLPATISGYMLIDELQICPENAIMNTINYLSPRGQLTAVTDEAGRNKSYQYDALQRLSMISDQNKNVLTYHQYNYAPAVVDASNFYFNTVKTGNYQKNNCSDGKTGTSHTYVVSAGSYVSSLSQADADALAQNEVSTKGQSNANFIGKCYYYNVVKSGTFYKSDCANGSLPNPMVYTVPAGTYTSEISQADADAQAQSKVDFEGSMVNASGTCYIPTTSFSVVNGQNTSSSIKVIMKNLSTNVSYTTAITTNGNTSPAVTIPRGTYSITFQNTGVVGSILLKRNGSNYECHLGGSFSNISVSMNGNESLQFIMSSNACPPLD